LPSHPLLSSFFLSSVDSLIFPVLRTFGFF
jgi:hypothetical protein